MRKLKITNSTAYNLIWDAIRQSLDLSKEQAYTISGTKEAEFAWKAIKNHNGDFAGMIEIGSTSMQFSSDNTSVSYMCYGASELANTVYGKMAQTNSKTNPCGFLGNSRTIRIKSSPCLNSTVSNVTINDTGDFEGCEKLLKPMIPNLPRISTGLFSKPMIAVIGGGVFYPLKFLNATGKPIAIDELKNKTKLLCSHSYSSVKAMPRYDPKYTDDYCLLSTFVTNVATNLKAKTVIVMGKEAPSWPMGSALSRLDEFKGKVFRLVKTQVFVLVATFAMFVVSAVIIVAFVTWAVNRTKLREKEFIYIKPLNG